MATDGGAAALVVDSNGRIHFINSIAARVYAKRGPREATGLRLSDFMAAPAANERMHDLWGGWALRCTVRRLDVGDNGGPLAIIVGAHDTELAEPADAPGRAVTLQHVDFGPLSGLTSSELKVMALIGEGMSNAEIAAKLHRAVKTVESHRAALTEKTGSASRVQLGIMARRAGLARRVTINDNAGAHGAPARS